MNKLEEVKEIIGSAIDVCKPEKEKHQKLNDFIVCAESSYCLVQWPDVQDYMEEDWFDEEAVLTDDSGYFIPFNRIFV